MRRFGFLAALLCGAALAGDGTEKPVITLDAFFKLEDFTDAVLSADGAGVAFVHRRSRSGANERFFGGRLHPHEREDIWFVASALHSVPRPLTFGAQDGSSYWQPTWSPDGRRLLLLTNQGFDNVHLELIEIASGERRRLSRRGVDLSAQVGAETAPMVWVDSDRVLFVELARDEVSTAMAQGSRRVHRMQEQWALTESGRAPAFSAIDSRPEKSPRPVGRLAMANARTGEFQPLVDGIFRKVTVSPDGRFAAAIVEEAPRQHSDMTQIRWHVMWQSYPMTMDFHTSLLIARLDGAPQIRRFPQVHDPLFNWIPKGDGPSLRKGAVYSGPRWHRRRSTLMLLSGKQTTFEIDAVSGKVREVAPLVFDPEDTNKMRRSRVSIERTGTGTVLWLEDKRGARRPVKKLNAFLQDFTDPKYIDLPYSTDDARQLTARLFLPPGYRAGDRLPVLTHVYIYQRIPPDLSNGRSDAFLNLSMALGRGFGVLYPTINPAESYWQGTPYKSVKRDVIPAVQAAIAAGVADPARMYVLGHSYGAYSVYALLAQSDVFAAAAAINGPSDLVTTYFDLDPNVRYGPWAFENQRGMQGELEGMHPVMGLGVAPWVDYERYVINSPLRHVQNIRTPLLIFHSDADVFDMHQADNMFSALTRLGRQARYVRVWGEDHSFDSPANIRAFWEETLRWFEKTHR